MSKISKLKEQLITRYFVDKTTKSIMPIMTPLCFVIGIFLFKIISNFDPMNLLACCFASLGAGLLISRILAKMIVDFRITDAGQKTTYHIYYKKKNNLDRLLKIETNLADILSDKGELLEVNGLRKKLQRTRKKISLIKWEINLFDE